MLDQGRDVFSVRILRGTLLLLMKLLFRIEHTGAGNVPPTGPLLVVANHVTYFDPFWISVRIYRAVRYMAWDKIFRIPVAGAIFRWFGAFPVSLESPEFSAFRTALRILQRSEAVVIFPEGGRSPDGRLLPFKEGAARLAIKTGAAMLPVLVTGGEKVWPRTRWLPRSGKVRVHYLQPISRDEFPQSAAALTEQVRNRLLAARGKLGV
jgi:1-acyl-sn-glycerol-3-phosphate acyltransferase